jgi:hypothetical protein
VKLKRSSMFITMVPRDLKSTTSRKLLFIRAHNPRFTKGFELERLVQRKSTKSDGNSPLVPLERISGFFVLQRCVT